MEKEMYKFDKTFFIERLKESKEKLTTITNIEEKRKIISMINFCGMALNKNNDREENQTKKENINDICVKLEIKLNNDLRKIDINNWKKFQYLYSNINKNTFERRNYNNINITKEQLVNIILDFYENIDEEYYKKALQIVQCPTPLINLDESSCDNDSCFYCDYLKVPFINVSSNGDEKYYALIHEIQHGINYLMFGQNMSYLFSELPSIFLEIIFTDIIDAINPCEGLYSLRINDNIKIMEWLNEYVNILIAFDKNKRKVTKRNISSILNVKKEYVEKKYNRFINKNFIEYSTYTLSFFKSLELREKYYNGFKKEVIDELKYYVSGKKSDINFAVLIDSYNSYIEEIKEKNKRYQKTVNL